MKWSKALVDILNCKHVLLWGYGREAKAAYAYLKANNPAARIYVLDDKASSITDIAADIALVDPARTVSDLAAEYGLDLVIKSPGISMYRPEFATFQTLGIPVTSGTEIWLSQHPGIKTIGVTGTKGKSTTSSLITYILKALGYEAELLGNVGIPLIGHEPARDFTVLELSSYQLAGLTQGTSLAVFTNLYEEHLSWHLTVENYHRDKLNLATASKQTLSIYNADDPRLAAHFKGAANATAASAKGVECSEDGQVTFNGHAAGTNFHLKGEHNLIDLGLALFAVAAATGRDIHTINVDFAGFAALPHRMSEHRLPNGVLAVDDSIATVPEATIGALSVYSNRRVHLLVGGHDRGIDLSKLVTALSTARLGSLVLSGPTGERLFDLLPKNLPYRVIREAHLLKGVEDIFSDVRAGDVVLLSPSAPSFDEFKDYTERGDAFLKKCQEMAGKL
jgi:UDP-N-acetylmuramoyl-L-alanine---L-glutamate ligase